MSTRTDDEAQHDIFDEIMRDKIVGKLQEVSGDDLLRVLTYLNREILHDG